MDELREAFPQLSQQQAEQIEYDFNQWMEAVGNSLIDYERRFAALIGFAAGCLKRQKERANEVVS